MQQSVDLGTLGWALLVDLVTGFFVLAEEQVRVGDFAEVADQAGSSRGSACG